MIKKCKKCGSNNFWLEEVLGWKCAIDEDGTLNCWNKHNEIDRIVCEKCLEEYEEGDFKEVNFQ